LEVAKSTLAKEGHQVQVSDLYAMGFNPVASPADFKERRFPEHMQYDREQKYALQQGTFSDDITAEIDKVMWCDLLLLQFPLWWYSTPAIMKGWFDRVFINGLMYGQLGRFNHGGLKGKRAMVSMTTGCFPGMVDEGGVMGHIDAMLWHLQYGTLAYVGFEVLEPFIAWSTRYTESDQREQYLAEFATILQSLQNRPVKFVHPVEDFSEAWTLKPGISAKTFGHQPSPTLSE
jgi:NAD(P)H dehydrogenase (quinone)